MLKQTDLTTTARLFSTAGTFGEIALVASHERILLDVQGRNYGVDGYLHVDHALAFLPLQTAKRLRDLLSEAICAAEQTDPRQPGLWSQATTRAVASQVRRGRLAAATGLMLTMLAVCAPRTFADEPIDRFREIAAACPVAIKGSDVTTCACLKAEASSCTQSSREPGPTWPAYTHKLAGSEWWTSRSHRNGERLLSCGRIVSAVKQTTRSFLLCP